MSRYFVTGATGFLGSELAKQLISRGHKVVALVRTPEKARVLQTLGAEIHTGDITDRRSLREPMTGVDGVFHVAAWYKVGVVEPAAEAINVGGTRNVLETMRELGVPKGVYTSSVAVFSDTRGLVPDEYYRYSGPHLSVYDRTKWAAHYEVVLPMMAAGLPVIVVMPGVVYGPGDNGPFHAALIDLLRQRLPITPAITAFCWAHVEDTARAHILAMEKGKAGETYIITGPRHSFEEAFAIAAEIAKVKKPRFHPRPAVMRLAARMMDVLGHVITLPVKYQPESLRVLAGATYFGSSDKAARELGFTARPLTEGMTQTIEHELRVLAKAKK
ncbi:MAG: NAD-dependent epimerase/dehydratase family protein [Vicinamibacterales bacterium]